MFGIPGWVFGINHDWFTTNATNIRDFAMLFGDLSVNENEYSIELGVCLLHVYSNINQSCRREKKYSEKIPK